MTGHRAGKRNTSKIVKWTYAVVAEWAQIIKDKPLTGRRIIKSRWGVTDPTIARKLAEFHNGEIPCTLPPKSNC